MKSHARGRSYVQREFCRKEPFYHVGAAEQPLMKRAPLSRG